MSRFSLFAVISASTPLTPPRFAAATSLSTTAGVSIGDAAAAAAAPGAATAPPDAASPLPPAERGDEVALIGAGPGAGACEASERKAREPGVGAIDLAGATTARAAQAPPSPTGAHERYTSDAGAFAGERVAREAARAGATPYRSCRDRRRRSRRRRGRARGRRSRGRGRGRGWARGGRG